MAYATQEVAGAAAAPTGDGSPHAVQSVEHLRDLLPVHPALEGLPPMQAPKVLGELDDLMSGFIERSPFLQLGTADAAGLPYVSPKGDREGFVLVVDPRTIVIPDRSVAPCGPLERGARVRCTLTGASQLR